MTEAAPFDPLALYGGAIAFDVYRNGTRVGEHTVAFKRDGDTIVAETRFSIAIDFLFFTAYRFEYTSTDRWQNGCLVSVSATTRDGGDTSTVTAAVDGTRVRIDGPKGRFSTEAGIFPTNHYHVGVIGSERVLNTITGGVNAVRIVDQGLEGVTVAGGTRTARHFAYTGELTNAVWYDDAGRWVAMRFPGKDGSTIELRCRSCGGADTAAR